MAGEGLGANPRAVLGTLLHEAAHGLAVARKLSDASRQGRYHNVRYRALAQEVGLEVAVRPPWGWTDTTPSPQTLTHYAQTLEALGAALTLVRAPEQRPGRQPARNPRAAQCQCQPPRRIRASEATLAAGPISCGVCGDDFAPDDIDGRR